MLSDSRKSGRDGDVNKNWFDFDIEDAKSLPSSEATVSGQDEEEVKEQMTQMEGKSI